MYMSETLMPPQKYRGRCAFPNAFGALPPATVNAPLRGEIQVRYGFMEKKSKLQAPCGANSQVRNFLLRKQEITDLHLRVF
jgi:hypothetical protein